MYLVCYLTYASGARSPITLPHKGTICGCGQVLYLSDADEILCEARPSTALVIGDRPKTLGPGAGGGQPWGEKCLFWTNFFSTVASRWRNPANKKRHPRQVSYLSNEVETSRKGGQLSSDLSASLRPRPGTRPGRLFPYVPLLLLYLLYLCFGGTLADHAATQWDCMWV